MHKLVTRLDPKSAADGSEESREEEAVRQIQSLSVASAPSPPPLPFERESSRTFFSRNQSISARHPLKTLLLRARAADRFDRGAFVIP